MFKNNSKIDETLLNLRFVTFCNTILVFLTLFVSLTTSGFLTWTITT